LKIGRKTAVGKEKICLRNEKMFWKQAKQELLLLGTESLYSEIMMYRGSTNKSLSWKLVKVDKYYDHYWRIFGIVVN
jgi:hypothetical protein